jgi:peptidoglycan hydrolase CwlO-like protein
MNIGLENATIYISIVTFSVWIAKCLIVSPLKESISGLQRAIEKLEKSISIMDSKIDQHDARLVRVEESACSAHKRIDRLDHLVDEDKQNYD